MKKKPVIPPQTPAQLPPDHFQTRIRKAEEEIYYILQKYELILIPTITMKDTHTSPILQPKGDLIKPEDIKPGPSIITK